MSAPDLACRDEQRRHKAREMLNGLDYVEVSDDQRVLDLHFFQAAPTNLRPENIQITGGSRIPSVKVLDIRAYTSEQHEYEERLQITVESPGDFSTYTLRVVQVDGEGRPATAPLEGFDPRYAQLRFSFKASCPGDLDCRTEEDCPPPPRTEPEIDYLAKDYASFRQLMLDRLSVTMPDWTERHVPDLGIALVEVLAYVADYLSYYQDAVATEAYLTTARRRISVRRHARLVDYQVHDGVNARAWVHVWSGGNLAGDGALDPNGVFFLSADADVAALARQVLTLDDIRSVPFHRYEVFEPLDRGRKIEFYKDQNEIAFHTWGDRQCCLPKGSTKATLKDVIRTDGGSPPTYEGPTPSTYKEPQSSLLQPASRREQARETRRKEPKTGPSQKRAADAAVTSGTSEYPPPASNGLTLSAGDYLLFEEVRGPETGNPADADPTRRHVVRLTRVERGVDPVENQAILEIEWAAEDALPFPLCLSAIVGPECTLVETISVARGNLVLVDHGRTLPQETLGVVPRTMIATGCEGAYCPGEITVDPGPFTPTLEQGPLVFAVPFTPQQPASNQTITEPDPRTALPAITLTSIPPEPDGSGPLVGFEFLEHGNWDAFVSTLRTSTTSSHEYLRTWLGVRLRTQLAERRLDGATLREAVERLREEWSYRRDLIGSTGRDRHFTIEVDNEGRAHLRFGDGELGRQPAAGTEFAATYRIGDPRAGNVGAEFISRIVFRAGTVSGIDLRPRNPLPAIGGTAPETLSEARLFAPYRFRTERQRAITADDYAYLAARHPKVQRAAAVLRWTGNGYEALVAIDQRDQPDVEEGLLEEIADYLDPFRRIGHTVRTVPARQVPLYLNLTVCVLPSYLRGHVKAAILDVLGNRQLADGRRGLFHPDNLTFGQSIFLSPILAMVQAVAGVESVTAERFERLFEGPAGEKAHGVLPIGPLEVARLDNDPSLPENGRLDLDLRGGR